MVKKTPNNFFWRFRGMLIPLFVFLVFAGVFFYQKIALATVLFQQADDTGQMYWLGGGDFRDLGTPSVNGTATQFKFRVKVDANITADNLWLVAPWTIKRNGAWPPIFNNSDLPNDEQLKYCFTTADNGEWVDVVWTFPSALNFDTGGTYTIYIATLYKSTGTPCAGTAPWNDGESIYSYYKANVSNNLIYFQIGDDLDLVSEIAIPYPENESTIADFWAFKLTFNAPFTYGYPLPSDPALNLQVCYGISQGAVADCQNSTSTWPNLTIDGNLYPNLIPGTPWDVYLHKTYQLTSSTTYYAKAYMYNIAGTFLAESPEISFTITGEPYEYNEPGITIPPTATSTEWTITCDPESGFFQYSFCYLFQYLFKPKPNVLDKWQNIKVLLENKPPLGYFVLVKNVLSGISTSTPAFQLAQATAVNENIFNPLKTGLSFVLYLIFGIWIFKRIAHLEL